MERKNWCVCGGGSRGGNMGGCRTEGESGGEYVERKNWCGGGGGGVEGGGVGKGLRKDVEEGNIGEGGGKKS